MATGTSRLLESTARMLASSAVIPSWSKWFAGDDNRKLTPGTPVQGYSKRVWPIPPATKKLHEAEARVRGFFDVAGSPGQNTNRDQWDRQLLLLTHGSLYLCGMTRGHPSGFLPPRLERLLDTVEVNLEQDSERYRHTVPDPSLVPKPKRSSEGDPGPSFESGLLTEEDLREEARSAVDFMDPRQLFIHTLQQVDQALREQYGADYTQEGRAADLAALLVAVGETMYSLPPNAYCSNIVLDESIERNPDEW